MVTKTFILSSTKWSQINLPKGKYQLKPLTKGDFYLANTEKTDPNQKNDADVHTIAGAIVGYLTEPTLFYALGSVDGYQINWSDQTDDTEKTHPNYIFQAPLLNTSSVISLELDPKGGLHLTNNGQLGIDPNNIPTAPLPDNIALIDNPNNFSVAQNIGLTPIKDEEVQALTIQDLNTKEIKASIGFKGEDTILFKSLLNLKIEGENAEIIGKGINLSSDALKIETKKASIDAKEVEFTSSTSVLIKKTASNDFEAVNKKYVDGKVGKLSTYTFIEALHNENNQVSLKLADNTIILNDAKNAIKINPDAKIFQDLRNADTSLNEKIKAIKVPDTTQLEKDVSSLKQGIPTIQASIKENANKIKDNQDRLTALEGKPEISVDTPLTLKDSKISLSFGEGLVLKGNKLVVDEVLTQGADKVLELATQNKTDITNLKEQIVLINNNNKSDKELIIKIGEQVGDNMNIISNLTDNFDSIKSEVLRLNALFPVTIDTRQDITGEKTFRRDNKALIIQEVTENTQSYISFQDDKLNEYAKVGRLDADNLRFTIDTIGQPMEFKTKSSVYHDAFAHNFKGLVTLDEFVELAKDKEVAHILPEGKSKKLVFNYKDRVFTLDMQDTARIIGLREPQQDSEATPRFYVDEWFDKVNLNYVAPLKKDIYKDVTLQLKDNGGLIVENEELTIDTSSNSPVGKIGDTLKYLINEKIPMIDAQIQSVLSSINFIGVIQRKSNEVTDDTLDAFVVLEVGRERRRGDFIKTLDNVGFIYSHSWVNFGETDIAIATTQKAGIIKLGTEEGELEENKGVAKVIGFDRLKSRVNNLADNFVSVKGKQIIGGHKIFNVIPTTTKEPSKDDEFVTVKYVKKVASQGTATPITYTSPLHLENNQVSLKIDETSGLKVVGDKLSLDTAKIGVSTTAPIKIEADGKIGLSIGDGLTITNSALTLDKNSEIIKGITDKLEESITKIEVTAPIVNTNGKLSLAIKENSGIKIEGNKLALDLAQVNLNNVVTIDGDQTINGDKEFSKPLKVADAVADKDAMNKKQVMDAITKGKWTFDPKYFIVDEEKGFVTLSPIISGVSWTPKTRDDLRRLVEDTTISLKEIDIDLITDLSYIFAKNYNIEGYGVLTRTDYTGCEKWNTENVTTIEALCHENEFFNHNIEAWKMGKVTNMSSAFKDAINFDQPLNEWDVSKVTTSAHMFEITKTPPEPDIKRPTDNRTLRKLVEDVSVDLSKVDTSLVKDFSRLFENSTGYELTREDYSGIENWTTTQVTNMSQLCLGNDKFNHNINQWNTINVTDMSKAFKNATKFNQELSNWKTDNVTTMASMFEGATIFNQELNKWNTGNVTNLNSCFKNAKAFNKTIEDWNVTKVKDGGFMFEIE